MSLHSLTVNQRFIHVFGPGIPLYSLSCLYNMGSGVINVQKTCKFQQSGIAKIAILFVPVIFISFPSISDGPVASVFTYVCRCSECKNSFGSKENLAAHFQESDPGGIDTVSNYNTVSILLRPIALKADKLFTLMDVCMAYPVSL